MSKIYFSILKYNILKPNLKWNEMDNFPIFNNDIKVSEDVPTLYFNFKMQVRTRNQSARNSNSTSIFSKSNFSTDLKSQEPWIQINPRK